MGAILRILGVVFIILLMFRIIARYLVPYLIKQLIKTYGNKFNQNNANQSNRKEGEVHVDDSNAKKKGSYSDKGDYVDFKETKEK